MSGLHRRCGLADRPVPVEIAEIAVADEAGPRRALAGFAIEGRGKLALEEHRKIVEPSVERSWRPVGTARQTAAIMASPDRALRLAAVQVPTLVIHGLVDPLVRPSGGIATAVAVPHSRLVMLCEGSTGAALVSLPQFRLVWSVGWAEATTVAQGQEVLFRMGCRSSLPQHPE